MKNIQPAAIFFVAGICLGVAATRFLSITQRLNALNAGIEAGHQNMRNLSDAIQRQVGVQVNRTVLEDAWREADAKAEPTIREFEHDAAILSFSFLTLGVLCAAYGCHLIARAKVRESAGPADSQAKSTS